MPKNLVEVITLSSSDEDSNPQVETAKNIAITPKLTARKSLSISSTIRNTTVKDEPPPSGSTPTKNNRPFANNAKSNNLNEHPTRPQQNAQNPLPNSNSHVPKVVSTIATSSNPAPITSTSPTVTASAMLSNSVTEKVAKLSGVTLTPVASSSEKFEPVIVSVTSQKESVTRGLGTLNKHFKPTSTSTPKVCANVKSVNKNHAKTVPKSFKIMTPIATSKTVTQSQKSSNHKPENAIHIKTVPESNKLISQGSGNLKTVNASNVKTLPQSYKQINSKTTIAPTTVNETETSSNPKSVNANCIITLPQRIKQLDSKTPNVTSKTVAESKVSDNIKSVNANYVKTLPERSTLISPKVSIATSKATTEAQPSLSISKLAKKLPGVSISTLGPPPKVSHSEIPTTLLASLGKTGITITKNTANEKNHESPPTSTGKQTENTNLVNVAVAKINSPNSLPVAETDAIIKKIELNGNISVVPATSIDKPKASVVKATINKDSLANKFVSIEKNRVTITKTAGTVSITPAEKQPKANVDLSATAKESFLKGSVPNSKLLEGGSTAIKSVTGKSSFTKLTTNILPSIDSIAVKPGTTITPVVQSRKQTSQNNTKVNHTNALPTDIPATTDISTTNCKFNSNNNEKQDRIAVPLNNSTQIKGNNTKLTNNETSRLQVPLLPQPLPTEKLFKSVGDSLSSSSSNKSATVQPVSVATSSKSSLPQTVNSLNIKSASIKRTRCKSDSHSRRTNKKAKLDPKPRLNGTHTNPASYEENMKRISALKESLKKIAEHSPEGLNTGQHSTESLKSRINGLVDHTKKGQHVKDHGTKNSKSVPDNKSSTKKNKNERPLKQVSSPKLSLKRKQANKESTPLNIYPPIPLTYTPIQPSAKKPKLDSNGVPEYPIPMAWKPGDKPKSSSSEPKQEKCQNSTDALPPQNAVPPQVASQKTTTENGAVWDESDDNVTKFNKLLEFSKSFMTAKQHEKCTIVKNFHKNLKKADSSYIESPEFGSLLNSTLLKIKDPKDIFIHLQEVKTELKAHKKSKIALTSLSKQRRLSSSSELSEAVSTTSNLEFPSDDLLKEVPTPNLADKVASAMLPNIKGKETSPVLGNNTANDYFNVPCSSKQADIIESLHFSMPVNNGVDIPSELETNVSETQRTSVDRPSSVSTTANTFASKSIHIQVLADPVPMQSDSDSEIEVVHEVVIAVPKDDLLKGLNLQSVNRQKVHPIQTDTVKSQPKAVNLPPIPVAEDVHKHKASPRASNSPPVRVAVDIPKTKVPLGAPGLPSIPVENAEQPKASTESNNPVKSKVVQSKQIESNLPQSMFAEEGNDSKEPKSLQSKIEKRVHLLEVYLGKLDKKIKKLQAKELSMDDLDDEESTYILEDRYKKKFQKTWAALCKLKKRSKLVGREIEKRFHYQGCRHNDINIAIEKLVNKRKPAEKFPNFVEVHNLLKKVNERSHLSLSSYEIENAAREAFEAIGKELKRRRRMDEDLDFGCYLTDNIQLETDPAEQDEELKKKLTDSVLEGERKIAEIIEKYAAREETHPETGEGSNCEESNKEEEMELDTPLASPTAAYVKQEDSVTEGSLQEPVGIEVTANSVENTDLPDTDPATPETDEREDNATPPLSISRPTNDVIDIDSSSSASTDPGPNATERNDSNFKYHGSNVFISDMIEIV